MARPEVGRISGSFSIHAVAQSCCHMWLCYTEKNGISNGDCNASVVISVQCRATLRCLFEGSIQP